MYYPMNPAGLVRDHWEPRPEAPRRRRLRRAYTRLWWALRPRPALRRIPSCAPAR